MKKRTNLIGHTAAGGGCGWRSAASDASGTDAHAAAAATAASATCFNSHQIWVHSSHLSEKNISLVAGLFPRSRHQPARCRPSILQWPIFIQSHFSHLMANQDLLRQIF